MLKSIYLRFFLPFFLYVVRVCFDILSVFDSVPEVFDIAEDVLEREIQRSRIEVDEPAGAIVSNDGEVDVYFGILWQ